MGLRLMKKKVLPFQVGIMRGFGWKVTKTPGKWGRCFEMVKEVK